MKISYINLFHEHSVASIIQISDYHFSTIQDIVGI